MKVLSLFDGISCARVALERAGFNVERYFASEIDKYAIQISSKNYPDIIQIGKVEMVAHKDAPIHYKLNDIDLLIGGSPCQDLSIAKRDRKGLDGERSGLFWQYVRILNEVKPQYFILENVASMPKEAKDLISKTLGVEPIMINASLVSAQNRKRLFWVGRLVGDTYKQVELPLPEDRHIYLKDIIIDGIAEKDKSLCVTATYSRACPRDYFDKHSRQLIKLGHFNSGGQGERVYSIEGKSTTLSAMGGGRGAKTGLYLVNALAQRGRHLVDGKRKDELGAKTEQRFEIGGDKANTITSVTKDSMVVEGDIYRKLHPIECERLQGLPDNYTEGISNSQRYKCLGNAFNVDVVAHILKFIK